MSIRANAPAGAAIPLTVVEETDAREGVKGALSAARIAVLIPCYNEETSVSDVVRSFHAALPGAMVYVYDNNSTDRTAAMAREAGAVVRPAPLQGKGNVLRRMFADVDADLYVMVDGDGTYAAADAPKMATLLVEHQLDMVCGARVAAEQDAYRPGHRFGNRMLTGLVREIFGRRFGDMLTGYRVFSRRFVKSFPAASQGFEVETELTVHALQLRLPCEEMDTAYGARAEGSASKLNTVRDGVRIVRMISLLVREERPLLFFGTAAAMLFVMAAGLSVPVVQDYLATGLVPRYPSLMVAVALIAMGMVSIGCGLILDTVSRARLEQRRLAYLAVPGPGALSESKV
jgi:hypothetical protein